MKRKPRLKYVKFQISKGKLYGYFNTGRKLNGKLVWSALPPYNTPGFWDSYNAMMGHRTRRSAFAMTIKDLVNRYEDTDEFKALKPNSRKLYRLTMDKVVVHFGDFPLEDVTRARVMDVLPVLKGNATRNIFLAVVGVLYRFARIWELTTSDPTKDIGRFKTGEHEPWPEELLDAALACDDARVRLAVHLLYYTGQRIGDVCKMQWGSVRETGSAWFRKRPASPCSFFCTRISPRNWKASRAPERRSSPASQAPNLALIPCGPTSSLSPRAGL
jgi:integrase